VSTGASSQPGERRRQGNAQELHASPLAGDTPRCQEITSAQELPPKFVVLMLAIYYVLYSIHIISVLDVKDDYTDD
jgi:hypothetical protein